MPILSFPPCETADDDDAPEVSCLTCEDHGEYVPADSDVIVPCPDCPAGEWNLHHEAFDDMRMR